MRYGQKLFNDMASRKLRVEQSQQMTKPGYFSWLLGTPTYSVAYARNGSRDGSVSATQSSIEATGMGSRVSTKWIQATNDTNSGRLRVEVYEGRH